MHDGERTSLMVHMLVPVNAARSAYTGEEVPLLMRVRNWMDRLTENMDLPGEPMPAQPLVELAGDRRVLIEHHLGVSQYSREQICVKVNYGHIQICGSCLELNRMTGQQLVVTGQIHCVTLLRR